jgi:aminopeptidase N
MNKASLQSAFTKAAATITVAMTISSSASGCQGPVAVNDNTNKKGNNIVNLDQYEPPKFITDHIDLDFEIHKDHTTVTSTVLYDRTPYGNGATTIILNADNPNNTNNFINYIKADGKALKEGQGYIYDRYNDELHINIASNDNDMLIEIETHISPSHSKTMLGLYESGSLLVTQAEPKSLSRITPILDRSDVQASYRVRIEASKKEFPVLMAAGEREKTETLPNNRHSAVFYDPAPKPSYLFALAAGDMDVIEDVYTNGSGRDVALRIFTEKGKSHKGRYALDALKDIMGWHEKTFQMEYERDSYNIVAVPKFSAGAMENTGLNLFLEPYVLLNSNQASYNRKYLVSAIMAHEFTHHRSGNRVTIRDLYNLVTKEGLTSHREQMYMAHATSEDFERIRTIRSLTSSMNRGSLQEPILLKNVLSLNQLYNPPVTYDKGAETFRMMRVMMGEDKFVEGLKNYFKKYDGQAVTIDDLVSVMEDVSGLDLSGQFMRWYTEPGQVHVTAKGHYNPAKNTYTLSLKQETKYRNKRANGLPFYVPVVVELVDEKGNNMPLTLSTDTQATKDAGADERVLHFTKSNQTFVFENVTEEPAFHSILDGLSAPVTADDGLNDAQLYKKLIHDEDMVDRWQAGERLKYYEFGRIYEEYNNTGTMLDVEQKMIEAFRDILNDNNIEPSIKARLLEIPSEKPERGVPYDVYEAMMAGIGTALRNDLIRAYNQNLKREKGPKADYKNAGREHLSMVISTYLGFSKVHTNSMGNKNTPPAQQPSI